MTDNVIVFPNSKRPHPPQNVEEMKGEIEELRKQKAEMVMDAVSMTVFETMSVCGIDVNSQEYMKDIFWMLEGVRSLIYKKLELGHVLHPTVEKIYYLRENGEEISCVGQFEKLKVED